MERAVCITTVESVHLTAELHSCQNMFKLFGRDVTAVDERTTLNKTYINKTISNFATKGLTSTLYC